MIDINALVKSNDQKSAINKAIPRPTIITINVRGIQGIHQHAKRSQLLGLLPLNLLLLPPDNPTKPFLLEVERHAMTTSNKR